jgi:membrane protein implicated in regulation of membrane protease activity
VDNVQRAAHVILVITLILALLFLPWPWNLVVIAAAAAFEVALATFGIRYTRRRRAQVGVQTLVGETGEVITTLAPFGQVKVDGVIWRARAEGGAGVGETVRINRVEGLTLEVERAAALPG